MLVIQARTDAESTSLLSDIAADQPRLTRRINVLRNEQRDIAADLQAIRRLIGDKPDDIEVVALRDQLAEIASRYRRHRSQEADLVYEAINVDLGGVD